ncbi:alpha/beta fold hydrolase [Micromonospora sp. NPDC004704]
MNEKKPTAVLVHGAFADMSSWAGVVATLRDAGVDVRVFANELRGGRVDGGHLANFVRAIDGPVVLVGHSYGGIVISEAASRADNVTGLVFVTAFALTENETALGYLGQFPATELGTSLVESHFTTADGGDEVELFIAPDKFHQIFAADLPTGVTDVLAVSQRPILARAFGEPAGKASWTDLPTWYVVATRDGSIHPEAQRAMARRSESITVEIDASHSVAGSQPARVARVIIDAVEGGEHK